MQKHPMILGLMIVLGLTASAPAGQKVCCVDPNLSQIQTTYCQGTLLPYHVALKRANDATKAETALARMTHERNDLQALLAKVQAKLKSAVVERDKFRGERDVAVADRDKARAAAANSAKEAKETQVQLKAAEEAKQVADVAATQVRKDLAKAADQLVKLEGEAAKRAKAAEAEAKKAAEARDAAITASKKSSDEAADLRKKLEAVLAAEDKKKDKQDEDNPKTDDGDKDQTSKDENAESKSDN